MLDAETNLYKAIIKIELKDKEEELKNLNLKIWLIIGNNNTLIYKLNYLQLIMHKNFMKIKIIIILLK